MLFNPQELEFRTGRKTAQIRAKSLRLVLADASIRAKLLLQTLEGEQEIQNDPDVVICEGPTNDVWQQTTKNLFKSYEVVWIDEFGWMTCDPKPEDPRDVYQVPEDVEEFEIPALWGQSLEKLGREPIEGPGVTYKHVQYGRGGDYILRRQDDHTDVWIVRKAVFENTYSIE